MYPVLVSKYNSNCENQVIVLITPKGESWHYLAIKKLSALLRRITSKYNGGFYCSNCFHSFRIKNKLQQHKKVCKSKEFRNIVMPFKDTKRLESNQYQNLIKHHLLFMQILNV